MKLPNLSDFPVVCIDVETTGVKWTKDRVFGVAIAVPNTSIEELIKDPVNAPVDSFYFDVRQSPELYNQLREQAPRINRYVNHNAKFDLHMLQNDGVIINTGRTECTMIRASLIDEHLPSYSLDNLCDKYLGLRKLNEIYGDLAEIFGGLATRNVQMANLHRAPVELVEKYARVDADRALRLWAWQESEMQRQELDQVWQLEKRLFPHIYRIERHGIRIDEELAHQTIDTLDVKVQEMQNSLNKIAGFDVNTNPSMSLMNLFQPEEKDGVWYTKFGHKLDKTPGGKPSINADALRSMNIPEANLVLAIRKYTKTKDTFIQGHLLGYVCDGRVHPNINQVKGDETGGTSTGRLSYTQPALQQIPSRDKEIAKIVRPLFLPDDGHGWTYGDLDQHELRIFHHYVNNPQIIAAYRENPDLDGHQIVADLTGLPRNAQASGGGNAKQLNLAMVFNMGAGELANKVGLPYTIEAFVDSQGNEHEFKKAGPEAQQMVDRYYEMVPGVKEISIKARSIAKSRGYVKTLFGRHLRFHGGQFTHKASGLVYQGTSADLNKDNIIRISEFLASEHPEAEILLNIHDELSVSIPDDADHKKICDEMKRLIQDRPEIRVPLRVDFSQLSANWWEATQANSITI